MSNIIIEHLYIASTYILLLLYIAVIYLNDVLRSDSNTYVAALSYVMWRHLDGRCWYFRIIFYRPLSQGSDALTSVSF
jgi:hypothetical protein